jgi:outer membrane protein assembly factor BamB
VDGDRVYALGAEGNLLCLRTDDGSVVWSRELTEDYRTKTPIWGFSGHPLIDGNKLICLVGGSDSVAVAFDKLTGKELWRALSAREPGYCPPTMIEAGGARQLLIWHAESLNSLNPETGDLYWSERLRPAYGMAIATPRLDADYLFVGAIVNKGLLLKLDPQRPAAEVVWEVSKGQGIGPVFSAPFLENGHMYGVDRRGELRCVKLDSGEQLWSTYEATTGARGVDTANVFLVKHQDRFLLANDKGDLIMARLSPQGYEEISRCQMLKPTTMTSGRRVVWSHPAFAQRCVFARNDEQLVCISLAAEE